MGPFPLLYLRKKKDRFCIRERRALQRLVCGPATSVTPKNLLKMWNLRLPSTSAQSESAFWQDLPVIYVHIKVWGAPTQCSVAAFLWIAITLSSQVKIHNVGMPIYFWANIHSKISSPEDFCPPLLTLKLSRKDTESITDNLNLLTMHFKKGKQGLDLHVCAWHSCVRTHTHTSKHTL